MITCWRTQKGPVNLRKTGNSFWSKNNSAFPSFAQKKSDFENEERLYLTLIRNDTWKIFSTEREKSVGWIVNIKKLIGCSKWNSLQKNIKKILN